MEAILQPPPSLQRPWRDRGFWLGLSRHAAPIV